MIRRHWKVWGICFVILLIYLGFKQHNMVVTRVRPERDCISENAGWIFGKYSSGRIVHARQCLEIAEGWDGLTAIWPFSLALIIVSLITGTAGGYALRDDDNADRHKRELSDLESRYRQRIEAADRKYEQGEIWESNSRRRFKEADQKEADANRREKAAEEKERDIDKIVEERVQAFKKQFQHLQEDHKNRGHKMEGLEKDKVELKRIVLAKDKEIIQLGEENLAMRKEILSLKREKDLALGDSTR